MPAIQAVRDAALAGDHRRAGGVGPGEEEGSVEGHLQGPVERRHAGDRRQPGVPGHRDRAVRRLQRRHRQAAVDLPDPDRDHRRADDLCHRRRAVRRRARRLGRGVGHRAGPARRRRSGFPRNISRLLVFKLGGTAKLPPAPPLNKLVLDPPAFTGTDGAGRARRATSSAAIARCATATRRSPARSTPTCAARARSAARTRSSRSSSAACCTRRGMVSWKAALTPDDAEAVRQYVIKRANEDKALETAGQGT